MRAPGSAFAVSAERVVRPCGIFYSLGWRVYPTPETRVNRRSTQPSACLRLTVWRQQNRHGTELALCEVAGKRPFHFAPVLGGITVSGTHVTCQKLVTGGFADLWS